MCIRDSRLGAKVNLKSKTKDDENINCLCIDWSKFEINDEREIKEVKVPYFTDVYKRQPPGYSGYVCEICWNLNYYVISCVRVASCRPGDFAFLWGGFGSCWLEAIPRCRSPPPSFP